MSLNIEKVWLKKDATEILVPISEIKEGDLVSVTMGNMIPLDGVIVSGEAMVNQASLTGESLAVNKRRLLHICWNWNRARQYCYVRQGKSWYY